MLCIPQLAVGVEGEIKEAGLLVTLPDAWAEKYEQEKLPTGQLMQRWVRHPIAVGQYSALPGMIVVATPVASDAELALLTQGVLSREPYKVKLGVETQCIKCFIFRVAKKEGVMSGITPYRPNGCTEDALGVESDCLYKKIDYLNLNLEPSWANRFEKDGLPYGKSYYMVVHMLVDSKLVDISFVYPKQSAQQIEPEITEIISSIRSKGGMVQ
jgi:hypothetical protein